MKNKVNITGKTLIDLGFRSGKWFPEAIEYINTSTIGDRNTVGATSIINWSTFTHAYSAAAHCDTHECSGTLWCTSSGEFWLCPGVLLSNIFGISYALEESFAIALVSSYSNLFIISPTCSLVPVCGVLDPTMVLARATTIAYYWGRDVRCRERSRYFVFGLLATFKKRRGITGKLPCGLCCQWRECNLVIVDRD